MLERRLRSQEPVCMRSCTPNRHRERERRGERTRRERRLDRSRCKWKMMESNESGIELRRKGVAQVLKTGQTKKTRE